MSNRKWNILVKVVEIVVVVAMLTGLFFAFTYAWDNDPSFSLSQTYTGR